MNGRLFEGPRAEYCTIHDTVKETFKCMPIHHTPLFVSFDRVKSTVQPCVFMLSCQFIHVFPCFSPCVSSQFTVCIIVRTKFVTRLHCVKLNNTVKRDTSRHDFAKPQYTQRHLLLVYCLLIAKNNDRELFI